jgi:hypothetical protein
LKNLEQELSEEKDSFVTQEDQMSDYGQEDQSGEKGYRRK